LQLLPFFVWEKDDEGHNSRGARQNSSGGGRGRVDDIDSSYYGHARSDNAGDFWECLEVKTEAIL
jgi:hypothetical protein